MKTKTWSHLSTERYFKRRQPVFPDYQDKVGMVSPVLRSRFHDLDPSLVFSRAEYAEVRRLMQKKEALGRDIEARQSEAWTTLDRRIEQLAAGALQRHIGIERYMVLDVERDDGYRTVLQVLNVDLHTRWADGPFTWSLSGRALRKNQTLGTIPESTSFDSARILRRTLSGTWVPLTPRPKRQPKARHAF